MTKKLNRSKRVVAHLREEKSAVVQAGMAQYLSRLVNLSATGALISSLDSDFVEEIGDECDLFFGGAGPMVVIRSEMTRAYGRHAAFKFLESSPENSNEIDLKIERMAALSDILRPTFVH